MTLTAHFTLAEMTITSAGLPNQPGPADERRLRALCEQVLEPWREVVGPLRVTSGFRSSVVNDDLRRRGYSASRTSQHMRGEAADVVPRDIRWAWRSLVELVAGGLPVDQAIVYQRALGHGWIHVSHRALSPRAELLVQPLERPKDYVSWASFVASGADLVLAG